MKKLNYNKLAMAFLFALPVMGIGCKKGISDFADLNINPGATTSPIPSALLTNVESGLGSRTWDAGGYGTTCGLYCQYFAETQYTDASRYAKPTFNFDGFYSGPLEDLQNIINYNSDPNTAAKAAQFGSNANQIAVARILKAYYFWNLTDAWGDMPYSQALQGNGEVPYDTQQSIYTDLFKELTEAVAQFDGGNAPQGDILMGGDVAKWKKFANSIRLLMALRLSKVDAATGKSQFLAALNDPAGYISSAADNVSLDYPGGAYQNIFYNYYVVVQRKDYGESATMTDWLSSNNDPRIDAFGSSNVGFAYGLTRNDAVAFANTNVNWARVLAPDQRTETSSMYLITADQVMLARAEAAELGWTSEDPITLYANAIQACWQRWGVYDATAYATYMAQPSISLVTNPLQKIAEQTWLAFYPNGVQGYSNWRRTGYPTLTPAPGTTGGIPRRIPYGPNEPQLNPTNYADAAARYNVAGENDSQYGKVWWDK